MLNLIVNAQYVYDKTVIRACSPTSCMNVINILMCLLNLTLQIYLFIYFAAYLKKSYTFSCTERGTE